MVNHRINKTRAPHILDLLRCRVNVLVKAVCISLLVAALLTYAVIAVTNNIQRNSLEILFLAAELQHEAGPDFISSKQVYRALLGQQLLRTEDQGATKLLSTIRPRYSPSIPLRHAIALLDCADTQVDSSSAIARAAVVLTEGGRTLASVRPVILPSVRPKQSPSQIADEFVVLFEQRFRAFAKEPTLERAESACMNSRIATAAILNAWSNSGGRLPAGFERFVEDSKHLKHLILSFSPSLHDEQRAWITTYGASVERRALVLERLAEGNLKAGHVILDKELTAR